MRTARVLGDNHVWIVRVLVLVVVWMVQVLGDNHVWVVRVLIVRVLGDDDGMVVVVWFCF